MNEMTRIGPAVGTQMDPMTVAQVFKASGMFPDIQSEAAACAKIIIGRGLGLTDFDAMTGLHIIKGKAVLAANLMAASIKRATGKYDYRATVTDTMCEITFFQRNDARAWEEIGTTTFTMDDARRAQLGGDNWRKYPRNMLFARCISNGYKAFCPDALGAAPVYVEAHGEMEITEDAPVTVQAIPAVALPAPAPTMPAEAQEPQDAPKPARKPRKAQEAAAAPQEAAKPTDRYPDEYEGEFKVLRVVDRPGKPYAIHGEGEHGEAWIATTVQEYAVMARDHIGKTMKFDIARVGNALTIMRVIGPLKPRPVNEDEVPF